MIGRCILSLFLIVSTNAYALSETDCLAYAVYKEAGKESQRGRRAVLDVLYNRMRIRNKTACQVVMEKGQFSWYRRGMKFKITIEMLTDFISLATMLPILPSDAEYFHNKQVHPRWVGRLKKVATVGNHIFYARRA